MATTGISNRTDEHKVCKETLNDDISPVPTSPIAVNGKDTGNKMDRKQRSPTKNQVAHLVEINQTNTKSELKVEMDELMENNNTINNSMGKSDSNKMNSIGNKDSECNSMDNNYEWKEMDDKVSKNASKDENQNMDISGQIEYPDDFPTVLDLSNEKEKITPVLRGKFSFVESNNTCKCLLSGFWGMSKEAFLPGGQISKFELTSQNDVLMKQDLKLPSLYDKYDGHFQIQTTKGRAQTVPEKNIELWIKHIDMAEKNEKSNLNESVYYTVYGKGTNRFGKFTLQGKLNIETREIQLFKIYGPPSSVNTSNNSRPKSLQRSSSVGQASSTVNGSASNKRTTKKRKTVNFTPQENIAAPSILEENLNINISRGRSERKRSLPSHLREDTSGLHMAGSLSSSVSMSHLSRDMKRCDQILQHLRVSQGSQFFNQPVDPVALNIPDYPLIIKEPMDFSTVSSKIMNELLTKPEDFLYDVRLIFRNAMVYNKPIDPVYRAAERLLVIFEKKYNHYFPHRLVFPTYEYNEISRNNTTARSRLLNKNKDKMAQIVDMRNMIEDLKTQILSLSEQTSQMQADATGVPVGSVNGNSSKKSQKKPLGRRPSKAGSTTSNGSNNIYNVDLDENELNRPMNKTDKQMLSLKINKLPQNKLHRVIQIISEKLPLDQQTTTNEDELEIDIEKIDTSTLRLIEAYVNNCLKSSSSGANTSTSGKKANGRFISGDVTKKRKRGHESGNKSSSSFNMEKLEYAKKVENATKEQIKDVEKELEMLQEEKKKNKQKLKKHNTYPVDLKIKEDVSSSDDSSSSANDDTSSESESDSDGESDSDDEHTLVRNNAVSSPTNSAIPKLLDESNMISSLPIELQNQGAWSNLAQQKSLSNGNQQNSLVHNGIETTSLWSSVTTERSIVTNDNNLVVSELVNEPLDVDFDVGSSSFGNSNVSIDNYSNTSITNTINDVNDKSMMDDDDNIDDDDDVDDDAFGSGSFL